MAVPQFGGPDDKRKPAQPVFGQGPEVGGIWTKAGTLLGAINEALGTAQNVSQMVGGGQTDTRGSTGGVSMSDQVRSNEMAGAGAPGGAVGGGEPVGSPSAIGGAGPIGGDTAMVGGANPTAPYNPYAPTQFGGGGGPSGAGSATPVFSSFAEGPVNLKPGEQGGPSTLQQLGQLAGTIAKMAGGG